MNKTNILLLTLILLTATTTDIIPLSGSAEMAENTWTIKASMQQPRANPGVAVVNGKIYVIGGSPINTLNEMYDPATNTWTSLASMPTGRENFGIAVQENKIYVIGGETASWSPPSDFLYYTMHIVTGANEVYDPATNTWETKASMPTPRDYLQANIVDGKIYLIGGQHQQPLDEPPQEHSSKATEVYDPATDSWTTMAPVPHTVYGYASSVLNNKIYVIGGWGVNESFSNQIFNPKTNSWTLGKPIPTLVNLAGAGATTGWMASKRIYVIGGCPTPDTQGQSGISATQVYDPESDTWLNAAEMTTSRYHLAVAVINDTLYAMGGCSLSQLAVNEMYTPVGYGTPINTEPAVNDAEGITLAVVVSGLSIVTFSICAFVYFKKIKKKVSS